MTLWPCICRQLYPKSNSKILVILKSLILTTPFLVIVQIRPVEAFAPRSNGLSAVQATRQTSSSDHHHNGLRMYSEPSLFEALSEGYSYMTENYYLPTQATTGGLCAAIGDVIAQGTEKDDRPDNIALPARAQYDFTRTFHFFLKGLGGGVAWSFWFDLSEPASNVLTTTIIKPVPDIAPSLAEQGTKTIISILMEQFLMCPIVFSLWDIPFPALLRGTPPRQLATQIEAKLVPLLIANSKVWTFANIITYNIPMEYRVLFASLADIVWQTINAGITSQELPESSPVPPAPVTVDAPRSKPTVALNKAIVNRIL